MLLRIKPIAGSDYLVLDDSGVLTFQVNSTIFNNQDDFIGSFTFPGTCQLEPNKALLQNAHIINSSAALRAFDVLVSVGGMPWKVGKLTFTIKNGTVNYTVAFDLSLIANQLKTTYLLQLLDSENAQLHFDTPEEYEAYLLSTTTAATGTMPMVFFPIRNDHLYKTIDPSSYSDYPDIDFANLTAYVNAWVLDSGGVGSFKINTPGSPVSQVQIPAFYLVYVLKRIVNYFGYTPVGSWLEEEEPNRIVIQSMIPVDFYGVIADYTSFMPYMLVSDLLKEVRTQFGLVIDFNALDKTCVIESLVNLENATEVLDLRDSQTADYEEAEITADAYTVTQQPDDKDGAYSDIDKTNLPKISVGDITTATQITDIQLASVSTKMISELGPAVASDLSNWRIPYMSQPIFPATPINQISELAYSDRTNFKIRFLYYHGMMPDDAGYLYPYASSDNLDKDGNALVRTSLSMGSAASAFVAVRYYATFLKNSKPFQQGFQLTVQQILALKPNIPVLMRDFNQSIVRCIFDSLSADVGEKEKIDTKLSLYPAIKVLNTSEVNQAVIPGPPPPLYDNGIVYAKLSIQNGSDFSVEHPTPATGHKADIYVLFFSDAGATMARDVTNLPVRYSQTITQTSPDDTTTTNVTVACTSAGQESELVSQAVTSQAGGGRTLTQTFTLLGSAYYTVIT